MKDLPAPGQCTECTTALTSAWMTSVQPQVIGLPPAPAHDVNRARVGFEFETWIWVLREADCAQVPDERLLFDSALWEIKSDTGRLEFISKAQGTHLDLFKAAWQLHVFILFLMKARAGGSALKVKKVTAQVSFKGTKQNLNNDNAIEFKAGKTLAINVGGNDAFSVRVLEGFYLVVRQPPLSRWGKPQVSVGVPLTQLRDFLEKAATTQRLMKNLAKHTKKFFDDEQIAHFLDTELKPAAVSIGDYTVDLDKLESILQDGQKTTLAQLVTAGDAYATLRGVTNAAQKKMLAGLVAYALFLCECAANSTPPASIKTRFPLLPRTNLHSAVLQLPPSLRLLFLDYCAVAPQCHTSAWTGTFYQNGNPTLTKQAWWVSAATGKMWDLAGNVELATLTRTCLNDAAPSNVDALSVRFGQVFTSFTDPPGTDKSIGAMRADDGVVIFELRHIGKSDALFPEVVLYPRILLPLIFAVHDGDGGAFDTQAALLAKPPGMSDVAYNYLNGCLLHHKGTYLPLKADPYDQIAFTVT